MLAQRPATYTPLFAGTAYKVSISNDTYGPLTFSIESNGFLGSIRSKRFMCVEKDRVSFYGGGFQIEAKLDRGTMLVVTPHNVVNVLKAVAKHIESERFNLEQANAAAAAGFGPPSGASVAAIPTSFYGTVAERELKVINAIIADLEGKLRQEREQLHRSFVEARA